MRIQRNRRGFTIIELLIVVIVIGVLAAAGLAKYQNFAETSRRKACIGQLAQLETGLAVWETTNIAFAENAKVAWGFTTRTGRLTDTTLSPASGNILASTTAGTISAIGDSQITVGGPTAFYNSTGNGPLAAIIRDDGIWDCPSAVSRYYGGEIQNIPDDYMDVSGGGVNPPSHAAGAVGIGGRYMMVVSGGGSGNTRLNNGGFPANWITNSSITSTSNAGSPCPQVPFKIAICGSYGAFGNNVATPTIPGTSALNQGGPVGPDGSSLNRHSARW